METKKSAVFCLECGEQKEYIIKSRRVNNEIRGVHFSYIELTAFCVTCNSEVYIPEVNDANVQAAEDAYRKASGLISVQEIQELLTKYDIGARPLAKIMGFGEITVNRYVAGQLPSKAHSDELLKVLASHKEMRKKLQAAEKELTPVAYRKCSDALSKLESIYSEDKIDVVTRYILSESCDITPLALQKLLYYTQAFFKALFKTELFPDRCQAWAHGPVYPDVYYKYREYGFDPIEKPLQVSNTEHAHLTNREIELIDAIIRAFGCYSGKALSLITHSEKPWIIARGNLLPDDRSTTELDPVIIDDYFADVVQRYNIVNPCDITNYSRSMHRALCSR